MKKQLLESKLAFIAAEKGFKTATVTTGFTNKYLLGGKDFLITEMCIYLWMCELQKWLRGKDIFISVDIWDVSSGSKYVDKGRVIFFKCYISYFKEIDGFRQKQKAIQVKGNISKTDFAFETYEEALEAGLQKALTLIQ